MTLDITPGMKATLAEFNFELVKTLEGVNHRDEPYVQFIYERQAPGLSEGTTEQVKLTVNSWWKGSQAFQGCVIARTRGTLHRDWHGLTDKKFSCYMNKAFA